MTGALHASRGPILLLLGIFVLWQGLYLVTGDVALRSPAHTFAYAADLFTRPAFWPNLQETAKAFGAALAIAAHPLRRDTLATLGARRDAARAIRPA